MLPKFNFWIYGYGTVKLSGNYYNGNRQLLWIEKSENVSSNVKAMFDDIFFLLWDGFIVNRRMLENQTVNQYFYSVGNVKTWGENEQKTLINGSWMVAYFIHASAQYINQFSVKHQ